MWSARYALVLLALGCQDPKQNAEPNKETAVSPSKSKPEPEAVEDETTRQLRRYFRGEPTEEDIRELYTRALKNENITYAHLKKNAERYKTLPWGFSGRIVQISESDGELEARISYGSSFDKIVYVVGKLSTDFVDGNRVDVLGILGGDYTYQSQAGWNITIPSMVAVAIEKSGTMRSKYGPKRSGK